MRQALSRASATIQGEPDRARKEKKRWDTTATRRKQLVLGQWIGASFSWPMITLLNETKCMPDSDERGLQQVELRICFRVPLREC
jgi:hypothetical protein